MRSERVTLVPYDPDWPRRFDEERRALAGVFAGSGAVIEHVGSTAVPGLGAKPVIDIMVGVPGLIEAEDRIPALEEAGYETLKRELAQRVSKREYTLAKGPFIEGVVESALRARSVQSTTCG